MRLGVVLVIKVKHKRGDRMIHSKGILQKCKVITKLVYNKGILIKKIVFVGFVLSSGCCLYAMDKKNICFQQSGIGNESENTATINSNVNKIKQYTPKNNYCVTGFKNSTCKGNVKSVTIPKGRRNSRLKKNGRINKKSFIKKEELKNLNNFMRYVAGTNDENVVNRIVITIEKALLVRHGIPIINKPLLYKLIEVVDFLEKKNRKLEERYKELQRDMVILWKKTTNILG